MTIDKLLEYINLGEDSDIEFKSAKGGFPKSLWESLSAFANSNGGYIVLGVDEVDDGFVLGSLHNPQGALKTFWDAHNNSQKLSSALCSDSDVSLLEIGTSNVMIIHVPMATRQQRPVFINGNPYTGTYKRNYEGDYHCSESEVRQMMRDSSDDAQDYGIVENFSLDDIDKETLNAYRNRFRSRQADHPYLALDDKSLLTKLGAYRLDRGTKQEGLTFGGLLMFGKESSITEALPHFHLDYQEHLSSDPDERWNYRITADGTWECNLYNFYYRVYNRIIQDIEVPFALDKEGIRIGETHVHEAIREVLANALIHADHRGSKSIVIIKRKDHFSFMNPGRLRISLEQLYNGGVSDPRNPHIQKMFQFLGLGEKAGSGFEKILRAWKEQSWLMPLVSEKIDSDLTVVIMPLLSMVPEKVNQALQALIGEEYRLLDEVQRLVLILAHQLDSISNADISHYAKQHPKDIGNELKKMVEKRWLLPDGVGRGRRYRLNTEFQYESSLPHLDQSLPHMSAVQIVQQGKKAPKELVKKAILEACNNKFLTASELATLLNRSVGSLRNHYLNTMTKEEGPLQTKYKESNHPNQAYRTKVGTV